MAWFAFCFGLVDVSSVQGEISSEPRYSLCRTMEGRARRMAKAILRACMGVLLVEYLFCLSVIPAELG